MSKKPVAARAATGRLSKKDKEQICFLEGLVAKPAEARKFLEDPAGYARAQGITLAPKLMKDIVAAASLGRQGGAAATTVAVSLPGGRTLRLPGGIRATLVASSNAVAVYATTTTVSQLVASATGGRRGGTIR